LGEFKNQQNNISIKKDGKEIKIIEPKSNPENVSEHMNKLIDSINSSSEPVISKSVRLAQEIWTHQPFIDGNKRLGRLLISFLTMKEGYPLSPFIDQESKTYNIGLIVEYLQASQAYN